MAVTYDDKGIATIHCDKCGHSETGDNKTFFLSGWILKMSARKYKNRCRKCQTSKERQSMDFVAKKFPPINL